MEAGNLTNCETLFPYSSTAVLNVTNGSMAESRWVRGRTDDAVLTPELEQFKGLP